MPFDYPRTEARWRSLCRKWACFIINKAFSYWHAPNSDPRAFTCPPIRHFYPSRAMQRCFSHFVFPRSKHVGFRSTHANITCDMMFLPCILGLQRLCRRLRYLYARLLFNMTPDVRGDVSVRERGKKLLFFLGNYFPDLDGTLWIITERRWDERGEAMRGTCWHANSTGPVANPSLRSAADGFPSWLAHDVKSSTSSTSYRK